MQRTRDSWAASRSLRDLGKRKPSNFNFKSKVQPLLANYVIIGTIWSQTNP